MEGGGGVCGGGGGGGEVEGGGGVSGGGGGSKILAGGTASIAPGELAGKAAALTKRRDDVKTEVEAMTAALGKLKELGNVDQLDDDVLRDYIEQATKAITGSGAAQKDPALSLRETPNASAKVVRGRRRMAAAEHQQQATGSGRRRARPSAPRDELRK